MKVRIATFGTQETVDRVKALAAHREEIEILPFVYTKAEETIDLIDKVFTCDVYLFTKPLSYQYVREKIEKKRLPAIQVDYDPYMLASSLYQLHINEEHRGKRIAIDILDEACINEILRELRLKQDAIHFFLHNPWEQPNIDNVLAYYEDLWHQEKIGYVLTSLAEVTEKLTKKNIPASTINIPDFNLTQAIDRAIALAQLNQAQNKQIVTGYINVKGLHQSIDATKPYKDDLLIKIEKIVQRFSTRTDATFIQTPNHTFTIIGTDKILNHLKEHYRKFPLLQELKSNIKLPIHLGFGLGLNAKESARNATIAIESCKRSEHSICYIVNERQEMIGPIGIKKEIDTSRLYRALIHDAKLNNELSYNFIDFIKERNNEPFSTNDVALFYQVTKRSAERTVNKLLTGKVIKVSGEERPYTKGRPRKLFTLNQ